MTDTTQLAADVQRYLETGRDRLCPICGSTSSSTEHDDGIFWVKCSRCGSTGPITTRYTDEEEGDLTWNTRATDPLITGLLEQIQRMGEALREQHNWHLQRGEEEIGAVDGTPIILDMGAEYCDSGMGERTLEVLTQAAPLLKLAGERQEGG